MAVGVADFLPALLAPPVSATLDDAGDQLEALGIFFEEMDPAGGSSAIGSASREPGAAGSGFAVELFEGLLYGQVHVIPASFDFGFILSVQTYDVELWNARRYATSFLSVDLGAAGGLSVGGLPSLPDHWPTSRSSVYSLAVSLEGAPQIDDAIVFGFTGEDVSLPIEGSRLVTFTISPNWEETIVEGFGYLSDVLVAYDGTEQRIQLRDVPVRSLEFTAAAYESAQDAALLSAILYDWQARLYGVPSWQEPAELVLALSAGATEIFVDTTFRSFEVGGLALLRRSPTAWEAFVVVEVLADRIRTSSPAQSSWPLGSGVTVYPMRVGRLADVLSIRRLSQEAAEADLVFEIET